MSETSSNDSSSPKSLTQEHIFLYLKEKYNVRVLYNNIISSDIIVYFHFANENLFSEITEYIQNLGNYSYGVVVNIIQDMIEDIDKYTSLFKDKFKNIALLTQPNYGFDVHGHTSMYYFTQYYNISCNYVILLHTKSNFLWRKQLIEPLLGNKKQFSVVYNLLKNHSQISFCASYKWLLPIDTLNTQICKHITEDSNFINQLNLLKIFDYLSEKIKRIELKATESNIQKYIEYNSTEVIQNLVEKYGILNILNQFNENQNILLSKRPKKYKTYEKNKDQFIKNLHNYLIDDNNIYKFVGGTILIAKYKQIKCVFKYTKNYIDNLYIKKGYYENSHLKNSESLPHSIERLLGYIQYKEGYLSKNIGIFKPRKRILIIDVLESITNSKILQSIIDYNITLFNKIIVLSNKELHITYNKKILIVNYQQKWNTISQITNNLDDYDTVMFIRTIFIFIKPIDYMINFYESSNSNFIYFCKHGYSRYTDPNYFFITNKNSIEKICKLYYKKDIVQQKNIISTLLVNNITSTYFYNISEINTDNSTDLLYDYNTFFSIFAEYSLPIYYINLIFISLPRDYFTTLSEKGIMDYYRYIYDSNNLPENFDTEHYIEKVYISSKNYNNMPYIIFNSYSKEEILNHYMTYGLYNFISFNDKCEIIINPIVYETLKYIKHPLLKTLLSGKYLKITISKTLNNLLKNDNVKKT